MSDLAGEISKGQEARREVMPPADKTRPFFPAQAHTKGKGKV